MTIYPNIKLSQVQKEFNQEFPFLRLEFFKHLHSPHQASPKKDLLKQDLTLKAKKQIEEPVHITENMPVSDLENLFSDLFGISAQVFRKSGRAWLETTLTDDWTLKRQNDEGFELSYIR